MLKTNYHTHTIYCDGDNTPREMIEAAISKGFTALGFSGHSHTSFDESYCMSLESSKEYREEIAALRDEYADRIEIYCGLEYDRFSDDDKKGLDYLIGSVHYVYKDGVYLTVDWSADVTAENVLDHYDGDLYAYCSDFYAFEGEIIHATGCDIIGHFDLVAKFNDVFKQRAVAEPEAGWERFIIDESDPRYIGAYEGALSEIFASCQDKKPVFEINTNAMIKYRSVPYPSLDILKRIKELGGSVTFSSDSHRTETLDQGFDIALDKAKTAGFDSMMVLTGGKFHEVSIK